MKSLHFLFSLILILALFNAKPLAAQAASVETTYYESTNSINVINLASVD